MIRIGEFAKIGQVTIKTLRFYDEAGLLKPAQVDPWTGYRGYRMEQLKRLNRILALKDLGLSLEQIGRLLGADLPASELPVAELPVAELRGMLRLKRAELQAHVSDAQARLARVEARLRQIEQENHMPSGDVVLKKIEPMLVAGVRGTVPTYPDQGELWQRLVDHVQACGADPAGPCLAVYHQDEPEIDLEVIWPLSAPIPTAAGVAVYELDGVPQAATLIHHGPFTDLHASYRILLAWIEANGYRICGPGREVTLQEPQGPDIQTDPTSVVELQYPVAK
jgi:DNA-binding transcriptional MerR regulator